MRGVIGRLGTSLAVIVRFPGIEKVEFLQKLDPALRERLLTRAREAKFEREEPIFHEGSDSTTGYFLLEGWVKLIKIAPNGKPTIVGLIGPGEALGIAVVYDACPYPATAVPATAGRMVAIPRSDIVGTLDANVQLVRQLFSMVSGRLRQSAGSQTMLAAATVESRLAQLCVELLHRMTLTGGDPNMLPRILTRREMAEMVGTSVETSIRVFRKWETLGILESDPEHLIVRDREKLEALVSASRGSSS